MCFLRLCFFPIVVLLVLCHEKGMKGGREGGREEGKRASSRNQFCPSIL